MVKTTPRPETANGCSQQGCPLGSEGAVVAIDHSWDAPTEVAKSIVIHTHRLIEGAVKTAEVGLSHPEGHHIAGQLQEYFQTPEAIGALRFDGTELPTGGTA